MCYYEPEETRLHKSGVVTIDEKGRKTGKLSMQFAAQMRLKITLCGLVLRFWYMQWRCLEEGMTSVIGEIIEK